MNTTTDTPWRRTWDPLAAPLLPLESPDPGPWLVDGGFDLFAVHPFADSGRVRTYATMARCRTWRSMFVVKTAYPDRMLEWLTPGYDNCEEAVDAELLRLSDGDDHLPPDSWPLANVIPAVTLATQAEADQLVPALLNVPAARLAVIIDKADRPIDLTAIGEGDQRGLDALTGEFKYYREDDGEPCSVWGPSLHWIIVPSLKWGELAPEKQWLRSLRDQCRAASIPLWSGPRIDGETVREFPPGIGVPSGGAGR